MKLLRKVDSIEVKRCFVISDFIAKQKNIDKEFLNKLNKTKDIILGLPETMLDKFIKGAWKKRLRSYNTLKWYVGIATIDEIGVWKWAGDLPVSWTRGSLEETAYLVEHALKENSQKTTKRFQTTIPRILKNSLNMIQKEKYLLPIIIPGGVIRKGLKRMKGDIDDGCMRSIALALSGKKVIKAYIGVRKKNKS